MKTPDHLVGDFCKAHGGYEVSAGADYFEATAGKHGRRLGVPEDRIFNGLSGYKRVLDSGVDALLVMDVPCFYPEQAAAAVDAGCHVYMAKPVAVDIPGVHAITCTERDGVQQIAHGGLVGYNNLQRRQAPIPDQSRRIS